MHLIQQERDPQKPFSAVAGSHSPPDPWETTRAIFAAHDPARFTSEWPAPENATPLPLGVLHDNPGLELTERCQREGQRHYYSAHPALATRRTARRLA